MGFELNEEKMVIAGRGRKQTVTGLVVNERPRTSAQYRRKIRQEMYYCRKFGVEEHLRMAGLLNGREDASETSEKADTFLQSLSGRIGYVLQMEPENREFLEYQEICRKMMGSH